MKKTPAILFAALYAIIMFAVMTYQDDARVQDQMRSSLQLAALALNTDYIDHVNTRLLRGDDRLAISQDPAYQALASTLKRITASTADMNPLWTYLILPVDATALEKYAKRTLPGTNTILSVLTIDYDPKDLENTLPGTVFNVDPYPAMKEITTTTKMFTLSSLVFDTTYLTWNRAGFYKVLSTQGRLVAVLALETTPQDVVYGVLRNLALSVICAAVLLMLILSRETKKPEETP